MKLIETIIILLSVILLILIVMLILIVKLFSKNKENVMEKERDFDKLIEIEYSCSGDMNGNVDRIVLNREDKTIIHEYKAFHNERLKRRKRRVREEAIYNLERQINKYKFPLWKDLEASEIVALDAPSTTITFTYDNSRYGGPERDWYTVDLESEMTKEEREAIAKFIRDLKSLIK